MGKNNSKEQQRILILATTASMIEQFNMHNIRILQSLGAEVHVATNFNNPGTITNSVSEQLISKLDKMGVAWHQIDFMRGIGTHRANKIALHQLCKVIKENNITGIHAHSPLGGIIGRRAAHKMHVKIIYTAHGFQFFKGGPLKDWLFFFPVEWFYAHWTDALVTINRQDYHISKYLKARSYYIPGVGINLPNISTEERKRLRESTRKKLSISKNDFLILSVGELNKNKNHATVIRAISKLKNHHIKYVIAGIGPEKDNLIKLIKKLHLGNQVRLLGYVNNLDGLYYAADLNAFLSKREGLGIGGLDGVARGLYLLGNYNTGMRDYVTSKSTGILISDVNDLTQISKLINILFMSRKVGNAQAIKKFGYNNVDKLMKRIYMHEFF